MPPEFTPDETYLPPSFRDLEDWGPAGEPTRLGEWQLIEQLGAGGWGVVYQGRHLESGIERAVKVLRPALAVESDNVSAFHSEARVMARFSSLPHVVPVEELGSGDGFHWMVMGLVEGMDVGGGRRVHSVAQWMALVEQESGTARLSEQAVKAIGIGVLTALEAAHGEGLVHRDVKPSNILLGGDGRALLSDFGLVKLIESELSQVMAGTRAIDRRSQTGASIKGTISYMSPEQEEGRHVDARSDLYSLGVVLYQLLTGQLPKGRFEFPGELDLGVDPGWDDFFKRALRPRPERRWQDAGEMGRALESLSPAAAPPVAVERLEEPVQAVSEPAQDTEDSETTGRGKWPWVVAALLLTLVIGVAVAVFSDKSEVERTEGADAETDGVTFTNGVGMKMIWLPAGSFRMGDLTGKGQPDEKPVRTVQLSGYHLGATEVTQGQWRALMGSNPSNFEGSDRLPVETVSWEDAMEFCRKLTARERSAGRLPAGYAYVLPTEAEWEHACRAGTEGDYAGDLDAMGWYDENSGGKTHRAGGKKPNAWGFYDMHGNVWEWCWTGIRQLRRALGRAIRQVPRTGSYRVVRGGGWLNARPAVARPTATGPPRTTGSAARASGLPSVPGGSHDA